MKPERRSSALRSRPIPTRFERPESAPYVWGESPLADIWTNIILETQRQKMELVSVHLPAFAPIKAK